MQSDSDPETRRRNDLLTSLDMVQHVHGPTHRGGGTLDLVLTFADQSLDGSLLIHLALSLTTR